MLLCSLLIVVLHCFLDNLLCIVLILHLSSAILELALLTLCNLVQLFLPFILCLSIDLLRILSSEFEISNLHKLIAEGEYLSLEVKVGLASLHKVLLDDPEVVVHASLALIYPLNH